MTILQARKILGKDAKGITDEKLQKEIEAATLLKDLFFGNLTKRLKNRF